MSEALWALLGVVVGSTIPGIVGAFLQSRQFAHERSMRSLDNQSSETAKEILSAMLNHRRFSSRSFVALRKPVGGFTDDELRRLLHELDAQRTEREDGSEWWYLREQIGDGE